MKIGDVLAHKHGTPKPKKVWMGAKPTNCEICKDPLSSEFIDGATMMGPWAIMCPTCHVGVGCGLGTGRGQRYDMQTLEKIEG